MHPIHLISFIISLIAAAVLLFMGIYGLVNPVTVTVTSSSAVIPDKDTKISEWVMIALGVLLLVFAVWSFVDSIGVVNLTHFFGVKKTDDGKAVVPPEDVKYAVQKFEDSTGIQVSGARVAAAKSPSKRGRSSSRRSR